MSAIMSPSPIRKASCSSLARSVEQILALQQAFERQKSLCASRSLSLSISLSISLSLSLCLSLCTMTQFKVRAVYCSLQTWRHLPASGRLETPRAEVQISLSAGSKSLREVCARYARCTSTKGEKPAKGQELSVQVPPV